MRLATVLVNVGLCVSLVACATTPDSKATDTPTSNKAVIPAPKAVPQAKKPTPLKPPAKPAAKVVAKQSSLNLAAMQGSWGLFPNALPFVVIDGQNFRWAKEQIRYPLKIQNNALVGRVPSMKGDWSDSCLANVTMRGEQLVIAASECKKGNIQKNATVALFKVAAHTYTDFSGKNCKQLQAELDAIYQQARQAKAQVKKLEKAGNKLDEALVKQDAERITYSMSILDAGEKQECDLKVRP